MMPRPEILDWLREQRPERQHELWQAADRLRRATVGDMVHLRGLIEFSNICTRSCAYCGIAADTPRLRRYRMRTQEILACARRAAALGYGTVVLQSGEDPTLPPHWLAEVIAAIKHHTSLAVTLSVGEHDPDIYARWRAAGADRYLLRFETSDPRLFARIHPCRGRPPRSRIDLLGHLRDLGYEIGSGIMVGIPGQTYASVADDLELFRRLDLDMIGIGPYIAVPGTALHTATPLADNVPATERMACTVLALARLVCPQANIPSTTALAVTARRQGALQGLQCGANVYMPNLTPEPYRSLYTIYPGKASEATPRIKALLTSIGRVPGRGPGARTR